jgi:8-oxo-dGTP diphosphatase
MPLALISFPGGHLDFGETWHECAYRELKEECGPNFNVVFVNFTVSEIVGDRFATGSRPDWFITNDIMPQYGKHYIAIFMVADWVSGEPVNMEPHKCEGWQWITFEELQTLGDKAAQWIPIDLISLHREKIGI